MKAGYKQNLPPGTLVYTGHHRDVQTTLTLIAYEDGYYIEETLSNFDNLSHYKGIKWLNVVGLGNIDMMRELGEVFNINPMVLEDIVHVEQRTKVEILESAIFAVFKMIYPDEQSLYHMKHEHISFFILSDMVITFQELPGDVFDGVRARLRDETSKIRTRGSDYLFYALIDAIVDHQMEVMLDLQNHIDAMEEAVVEDELSEIEVLYRLRKSLLILKAGALPIQETLSRFLTSETALLTETTRLYFQDVIDHATHLSERIITYREIITSLFEMHQTHLSNKMNKVMTTLTIFSAIFIPLSFLAGFYGMNFKTFPTLNQPLGIPIFIGACVIIAGSMLAFFKKNNLY